MCVASSSSCFCDHDCDCDCDCDCASNMCLKLVIYLMPSAATCAVVLSVNAKNQKRNDISLKIGK